jgi:putative serine protease PepD
VEFRQARIAGPLVMLTLVALTVGAAGVAGAGEWRAERQDAQALASQARTIAHLEAELNALDRNAAPDWQSVAATVEASVVTVSTDGDLGSGWVAASGPNGSDIVTNYHVVADTVTAGSKTVDVLQRDLVWKGTIVRTDATDDLAVVHVSQRLPRLPAAAVRPRVGAPVMAAGAPLGLSGSISVGVVSGFHSIFGADYLQFTAPISPGNSGGPVVDGRGRVVGIATAKLVADGAEALGLAIPVQTACAALVACTLA